MSLAGEDACWVFWVLGGEGRLIFFVRRALVVFGRVCVQTRFSGAVDRRRSARISDICVACAVACFCCSVNGVQRHAWALIVFVIAVLQTEGVSACATAVLEFVLPTSSSGVFLPRIATAVHSEVSC